MKKIKEIIFHHPIVVGTIICGIVSSIVLFLVILDIHENNSLQNKVNNEFLTRSHNGALIRAISDEELCRGHYDCKVIVENALKSNSKSAPIITKKNNPILYSILHKP